MRVEVDPSGAPSPRTDHRSEIVQLVGAGTTVVALAVVYALGHHGVNVMGWYANFLIPAGAMLVGWAAASGYVAAAWFTGLRPTRKLIVAICGELVLAYFIAEYEEYQQLHADIGFWTWFDLVTRAFTFSSHPHGIEDGMGAAGYVFRTLEITGFVLGGALLPLVLRGKSYCEPCRVYRRKRAIAWVPGGLAGDDGVEAVGEIFAAAVDGDRAALERKISLHGPLENKRKVQRYASRVAVELARCPRCADSELLATRFQGSGKHVQRIALARKPIAGDRVRALFD